VLTGWPSGGSNAKPIDRYWGAYVYRVYTTNTHIKAVDAWVFDPHLIEAGTNTTGPAFGYLGGPAVLTLVR
jgi:hypothetical protein